MKRILGLLLFFAAITASAQTVVSGSRVQYPPGTLLASGQWCFGATCTSVSSGVFSESVTAGTQTVTVTDGGSNTYLSITGVAISGSTFNWDGYVTPSSATTFGKGAPTFPAALNTIYTQTDSTPANAPWQNLSVNGQLVWVKNPPTYIAPSGLYGANGAPSFSCTAPCSYIQADASPTSSATWALVANAGLVSQNWVQQTGTGTAVNLANGIVTGTGTGGANSAATAATLSSITTGTDSGSANVYTVALSPAPASITTGLIVNWVPNSANTTTTPTLAVSPGTAHTLVKTAGAALAANDIITTVVARAQWNGTTWVLLNPQTTSGGSAPSIVPATILAVPYGTGGATAAVQVNPTATNAPTAASDTVTTMPVQAPAVSTFNGTATALHLNGDSWAATVVTGNSIGTVTATNLGATLTNSGVGGTTACEVTAAQTFQNDNPGATGATLYMTADGEINDYNNEIASGKLFAQTYLASVNDCEFAGQLWDSTASTNKILGSAGTQSNGGFTTESSYSAVSSGIVNAGPVVVTAASGSGGVITFTTTTQSPAFVSGEKVAFPATGQPGACTSGMTAANGVTFTVLTAGLTTTQFEATSAVITTSVTDNCLAYPVNNPVVFSVTTAALGQPVAMILDRYNVGTAPVLGTPVLSGGGISSIPVTSAGTGCTPASAGQVALKVLIFDSTGTGAAAHLSACTAGTTPYNSTMTGTVVIDAAGSGYTAPIAIVTGIDSPNAMYTCAVSGGNTFSVPTSTTPINSLVTRIDHAPGYYIYNDPFLTAATHTFTCTSGSAAAVGDVETIMAVFPAPLPSAYSVNVPQSYVMATPRQQYDQNAQYSQQYHDEMLTRCSYLDKLGWPIWCFDPRQTIQGTAAAADMTNQLHGTAASYTLAASALWNGAAVPNSTPPVDPTVITYGENYSATPFQLTSSAGSISFTCSASPNNIVYLPVIGQLSPTNGAQKTKTWTLNNLSAANGCVITAPTGQTTATGTAVGYTIEPGKTVSITNDYEGRVYTASEGISDKTQWNSVTISSCTNTPVTTVSAYSYANGILSLTTTAQSPAYLGWEPIKFSGFTGNLVPLNGLTFPIQNAGLTTTNINIATTLVSGSGSDSGSATPEFYLMTGYENELDESVAGGCGIQAPATAPLLGHGVLIVNTATTGVASLFGAGGGNWNGTYVGPKQAVIAHRNSTVGTENWYQHGVTGGPLGNGTGPQLASAATISPLFEVTHITGTTTINTITAPSGCTTTYAPCVITLIFDGIAPVSATGNVFAGFTPVTGQQVILTYDAATSKWYTSTYTTSGNATLSSGTVTVSTAAACTVAAGCTYSLANCGAAGTGIGVPAVGTITAGTSFVINSESPTNTVLTTDTSKICWKIN